MYFSDHISVSQTESQFNDFDFVATDMDVEVEAKHKTSLLL